MEYGDRDGHGYYGQLTEGDTGGIICHECGTERVFLGRHVRVHGMTAAQYREAHGLGRSTSLASPDLRDRWSEKASARVGSPEWSRFEQARNPAAATEASREATADVRPQVVPGKRAQALAAPRSRPARECDVDGCGRKHVADGLCRTHYYRRHRTGDVQDDVPVRPRQGGPKKD